MASTILAYPDRTRETATVLTGGAWSTALPLANLKTRPIKQPARTADALAASTQWVVNLGSAMDVRVVALLGHNLSLAATIRARAYSDSGLTQLVHDTGTVNAYPVTFGAKERTAYPNNWILPLASIVTAQYWKWEITDTANAAGYLEIGRCWIGPAWQPSTGISYGDSLGYEPQETVTESHGGNGYTDGKLPRRAGAISFPQLKDASSDERDTAMIFQKTIGLSGEIIYIEHADATAKQHLLYSFPATVRQMSPIRLAGYDRSEMPLEIIESL